MLASLLKQFQKKTNVKSPDQLYGDYYNAQTAVEITGRFGALDESTLWNVNSDLIQNIKDTFGFNDLEFEKSVKPLILRAIRFYHLLPSSYGNHHKKAGEGLRHVLEVGYYAVREMESVVNSLDRNIDVSTKVRRREHWLITTLIAALTHDAGKCLRDCRVHSGRFQFEGGADTILDWIERNQLKHYFVEPREGRNLKEHETYSSVIAYQWATLLASYLPRDILDQLVTTESSNYVYKAVVKADRMSAMHYRKISGSIIEQAGNEIKHRIIQNVKSGLWEYKNGDGLLVRKGSWIYMRYPEALNHIRSSMTSEHSYVANNPADMVQQMIACSLLDSDEGQHIFRFDSKQNAPRYIKLSEIISDRINAIIIKFENSDSSDENSQDPLEIEGQQELSSIEEQLNQLKNEDKIDTKPHTSKPVKKTRKNHKISEPDPSIKGTKDDSVNSSAQETFDLSSFADDIPIEVTCTNTLEKNDILKGSSVSTSNLHIDKHRDILDANKIYALFIDAVCAIVEIKMAEDRLSDQDDVYYESPASIAVTQSFVTEFIAEHGGEVTEQKFLKDLFMKNRLIAFSEKVKSGKAISVRFHFKVTQHILDNEYEQLYRLGNIL